MHLVVEIKLKSNFQAYVDSASLLESSLIREGTVGFVSSYKSKSNRSIYLFLYRIEIV